jgi:hypothetical protein
VRTNIITKETSETHCDMCRQRFPDNLEEVIYHTELGEVFCSEECIIKADKEFWRYVQVVKEDED